MYTCLHLRDFSRSKKLIEVVPKKYKNRETCITRTNQLITCHVQDCLNNFDKDSVRPICFRLRHVDEKLSENATNEVVIM